MDQHPTTITAPSRTRRSRHPTWLRLTLGLVHLISVALFMFTRFLETALRDPLAWAILGAAVVLRSVYQHWPN
jgi:hypothetical protein